METAEARVSGTRLPVDRVDAGSKHVHQHLIGAGMRHGQLLELQDIGAAGPLLHNRRHALRHVTPRQRCAWDQAERDCARHLEPV